MERVASAVPSPRNDRQTSETHVVAKITYMYI